MWRPFKAFHAIVKFYFNYTPGENIEASILVVVQLMELGVKEIIAKAVNPLHGRILERLGISRVKKKEKKTH